MSRSRVHKIRRRLTVDGVVYRYCVSPDDGFIGLTVWAQMTKNQFLWVRFSYGESWVAVGNGIRSSTGHRLILPRVVRLAILEGVRRGWQPRATTPTIFRMFDGDELLRPEDWPRFFTPLRSEL